MASPRKKIDIRRPDVRALIRSFGPGTFPAVDLYVRYCAQMNEQGRTPVSQQSFGRALTCCGQTRTKQKVHDRSVWCWRLNERRMAAEEHDSQPARF